MHGFVSFDESFEQKTDEQQRGEIFRVDTEDFRELLHTDTHELFLAAIDFEFNGVGSHPNGNASPSSPKFVGDAPVPSSDDSLVGCSIPEELLVISESVEERSVKKQTAERGSKQPFAATEREGVPSQLNLGISVREFVEKWEEMRKQHNDNCESFRKDSTKESSFGSEGADFKTDQDESEEDVTTSMKFSFLEQQLADTNCALIGSIKEMEDLRKCLLEQTQEKEKIYRELRILRKNVPCPNLNMKSLSESCEESDQHLCAPVKEVLVSTSTNQRASAGRLRENERTVSDGVDIAKCDSTKEKNAYRDFLIHSLQKSVESLQQQLEEQRRTQNQNGCGNDVFLADKSKKVPKKSSRKRIVHWCRKRMSPVSGSR